jgi:hypothetical protein
MQSGSGSYFQYLAPPAALNDFGAAVPAMALVEVLTSQRRELTVRTGSPGEIVEHRMRVIEVLKDDQGDLARSPTIQVSQADDVKEFPAFVAGQRLILMLKAWPEAGTYGVLFGAQGTMAIDGERVAIPSGISRIKEFSGQSSMPLTAVLDVLRMFNATAIIVDYFKAPQTLEEFRRFWQSSEAVAFGEVVQSEQRLLSTDTPIMVHQLRVIEVIKDDGAIGRQDTFAFAQYGGRVFANGRLHIGDQSGFPVLRQRQRVVLFLSRWPAANAYSSAPFGVFAVQDDAVAVKPFLAGFMSPLAERTSIPLDEFLTILRTLKK